MFTWLLFCFFCHLVLGDRCALVAIQSNLLNPPNHQAALLNIDTGALVDPLLTDIIHAVTNPPNAVAIDRRTSTGFFYDYQDGHLTSAELCSGDHDVPVISGTANIAGLTYNCHNGLLYGVRDNGDVHTVDSFGNEVNLGKYRTTLDYSGNGLLVSKDGTKLFLLDVDIISTPNVLRIWSKPINGDGTTASIVFSTSGTFDTHHGALTWQTLGDDEIIIYCQNDKCYSKNLADGLAPTLYLDLNDNNIHFDGFEIIFGDFPNCMRTSLPCLGVPSRSHCDGYPCEIKMPGGIRKSIIIPTFEGAFGIRIFDDGSTSCSINSYPDDTQLTGNCRYTRNDGFIGGPNYIAHITRVNGGGSRVHVLGECYSQITIKSGDCQLFVVEDGFSGLSGGEGAFDCTIRALNGAILQENNCFYASSGPVAIEVAVDGVWGESDVVGFIQCEGGPPL